MDLQSLFKHAMATGGPGGLFVAAAHEAVALLRTKVRGSPYRRVLPKQFTSTATLTLSGTSGVASDFVASDYKNDGKYDHELRGIYPINVTGSSAWRLAIDDTSQNTTFFGAPTPIRVTQLFDSNRQPTLLSKVKYKIPPDGGYFPRAQSVGTADTVELTLDGIWIVEE